ncbi:MAG: DUF167 domain-containing protein [Candidatus Omnitrophica bacterium]|nr:DUF167 domain-containing protein [Candidatus Omnitrophota bacterium]
MKIQVKVCACARTKGIFPTPDGGLTVKVTEPAKEGRANAAVIEMLARHFGLPRGAVRIVRGETSRRKLIEIDLEDRRRL